MKLGTVNCFWWWLIVVKLGTQQNRWLIVLVVVNCCETRNPKKQMVNCFGGDLNTDSQENAPSSSSHLGTEASWSCAKWRYRNNLGHGKNRAETIFPSRETNKSPSFPKRISKFDFLREARFSNLRQSRPGESNYGLSVFKSPATSDKL